MLKKIKHTIQRLSLLKKGDKVLVAVSGGPDSVCLLLALYSLGKELGVKVLCAHLNHQLRGAESNKDEAYVIKLSDKLNIPILVESRDVEVFAKKNKFSIEQAARELRYDFLLGAAKEVGANKIATGHTRDDQAETVLMRLLRGAGLKGLRAIPPVRKLSSNVHIIRPLIDVSKKEITSFLRRRNIKSRLDSTNKKDIFLRNKIRHNLIPYLEKHYSLKIKDILARTANNLDGDYSYLMKQQRRIFKKISSVKNNKNVTLPIKDLRTLDIALKRGVIRLAIEAVKGDLKNIDYRHWNEIEDLILKRKAKSEVHLPGGINVVKKERSIVFKRRGKNGARHLKLKWCQAPFFLRASVSSKPPKRFSASRKIEYFDFDKINFPLKVRYRKPHDKIRPLGMKKYKRIKDIFIDDKIKVNKRASTPIVVDAKGKIAWICGVRICNDFKVTSRTKKCLRLYYV